MHPWSWDQAQLRMGASFWKVQWRAHVFMMNVKRWWPWFVLIGALWTWRDVRNTDWSWVLVAHVGSLLDLKTASMPSDVALRFNYIVVSKDKSILTSNISLDALSLMRYSLSFLQSGNIEKSIHGWTKFWLHSRDSRNIHRGQYYFAFSTR